LDFWAYKLETCKFHYFYIITNTKTNKLYCGIHSTNNKNDDYIGSGTDLLKDYKKHGRDHFSKKIISFFDSRKQASEFERYFVTKEFIASAYTYNKRVGGDNGGILKHTEESRKKISDASKETISEYFIYYIKNKRQVYNPNTGKRKVVDKEDLQIYLENGYVRGTGIVNKTSLNKRLVTNEESGTSTFVDKDKVNEYLNGGYTMGINDARSFEKRSNAQKGLKTLYNKELDKHTKVKPELVDEYLENGWILGMSEELTKAKGAIALDTVWITNIETNECIKIKSADLQSYLDNGWIKKRTMEFSEEGLKKCGDSSRGLVFVYDPSTQKGKRVKIEEAEKLISEGWVKGRPFKKRNRKKKSDLL